jgi:hypothetical protein
VFFSLFSELFLCVSSFVQFRVLVFGVFFSSVQARGDFIDLLDRLLVLCLLCSEFGGNRSS